MLCGSYINTTFVLKKSPSKLLNDQTLDIIRHTNSSQSAKTSRFTFMFVTYKDLKII